MVARQDVLDDGQSQTGTARVARAAAVHAVEPLGQARDVLGCNAQPRIADRKHRMPVGIAQPDRNPPAVRRVAHRVRHQIAQRRQQLALRPAQHHACVDLRSDLVAALRQRLRIVHEVGRQRTHVYAVLCRRLHIALQFGQRQQVFDNALHAHRLHQHQVHVAPAVFLGHRQVAHRLQEAGKHGQRRLQFMRHIGHEIAPHGFGVFHLGDVLRQHELAALAVRKDLDRGDVALVLAHVAHDQRFVVAFSGQILDELGAADQVRDALAHIAPRVQAEMLLGHAVAPFDLVGVVQHQHTVRRCLDGLDKARVLLLHLEHLRAPALDQPMQPVIDLAPEPQRARDFAIGGGVEHLPQPVDLEQVVAKLQEQRDTKEGQAGYRPHKDVQTGGDDRQADEDGRRSGPDDIHERDVESGGRPDAGSTAVIATECATIPPWRWCRRGPSYCCSAPDLPGSGGRRISGSASVPADTRCRVPSRSYCCSPRASARRAGA
ncbi:hypothetical protein D3C81_873310 [compost metagenome]